MNVWRPRRGPTLENEGGTIDGRGFVPRRSLPTRRAK